MAAEPCRFAWHYAPEPWVCLLASVWFCRTRLGVSKQEPDCKGLGHYPPAFSNRLYMLALASCRFHHECFAPLHSIIPRLFFKPPQNTMILIHAPREHSRWHRRLVGRRKISGQKARSKCYSLSTCLLHNSTHMRTSSCGPG